MREMKGLSPLYLVLTSLLVYTISANVVESDFICEKDVVPKDRINTAIFNACSSFSDLSSRTKFPAEFDPSTTYFIQDAILFSWPVVIHGDQYIKGHAGKFRLLLDSSCVFYGMIIINKNEPVKRCYQPVESEYSQDLSSSSGPRKQPILRGYRCQNKIFDMSSNENTVRTAKNFQKTLKDSQNRIHLHRYEAVDELFQSSVYLVPNESARMENYRTENSPTPYFVVMNSQFKMLDMVYKSNNIWTRCDKLFENEPEPRYSSDIVSNSIGEINFPGVKSYKCGPYKFTRKSVNSHMQLGCNVMLQYDKSSNTINGKQDTGSITPNLGTFITLKQSLKLPEAVFQSIGRDKQEPNKAFIFFDKNCNFYGAYWYHKRNFQKCDELSP
ncbi:putative candidate secreted effector protein [Blumeria hordei DH14]|uniref:Putative candidate secreted effector protein n=1 Tax=Blumeria graminis f. sp. hordei (strain DH14) TaxID=546991 RepID=N1JJX1_BLUG1|nr:putative candidate secreted effector protein [Blumeria hordei DH14]